VNFSEIITVKVKLRQLITLSRQKISLAIGLKYFYEF